MVSEWNAASSCTRPASTRSTSSGTAKCAGRSFTTCAEESERAHASGRSAQPLPQLPSPPTAKSQQKRPKRPKADRDLWVFERQAFGLGYATVAGVDEAGRGPWAGPVGGGGGGMGPYFHSGGVDDTTMR